MTATQESATRFRARVIADVRQPRLGYLVEEQGMTYMADRDADNPLRSLQAASCTYRIALGARAGELKTIATIEEPAVIVKILTHLVLPARAPRHSPARPALA